ncbi:MAG: hypothetical protein L6R37_008348, partial [Teloschistes peruensis]
ALTGDEIEKQVKHRRCLGISHKDLRGEVEEYSAQRSQAEVIRVNIGLGDLREKFAPKLGPDHPRMTTFAPLDQYTTIPASEAPLLIMDKHRQPLVIRIRIPLRLTEGLEEADGLIPEHQITPGANKRGEYEARHWTCWRGYKTDISFSGEYLKEKEAADKWFDASRELIGVVSQKLRMWAPEMWKHMQNVTEINHYNAGPTRAAGTAVRFLAAPFAGVAINRRQETDGNPHIDWKDHLSNMNAVTPYGTGFSGGDILFHDLGFRLEFLRGDLLFFWGRFIRHNVVDITGERNSVDFLLSADVHEWRKSYRKNKLHLQTTNYGPGKRSKRGHCRPRDKNRKRGKDRESTGNEGMDGVGRGEKEEDHAGSGEDEEDGDSGDTGMGHEDSDGDA